MYKNYPLRQNLPVKIKIPFVNHISIMKKLPNLT